MFDSFLSMVNGDALSGAASRVLERQIAPLYQQVREELLSRVTGTPPPTFAQRLGKDGVPVDDATAQILWSACIGALADQPAEEEPRALTAVDARC